MIDARSRLAEAIGQAGYGSMAILLKFGLSCLSAECHFNYGALANEATAGAPAVGTGTANKKAPN